MNRRVRLIAGLGHTCDHEVIVVPELDLPKAAELVHVLSRILGMDGERDLPVAGSVGRGQGFEHERSPIAHVLKLRFEGDAELGRFLIHRGQTNPTGRSRSQQAPASVPLTWPTTPTSDGRPQFSA